uniref:Uncharacterized protein n=1 Tax=Arundo donax TaxID=35708 RepID=A0A0A9DNR9_ARUDO
MHRSHEGAGVGVVIAEDRGEALLLAAGGRDEGVHPAHVTRRGPLVVDRRRHVEVSVGYIGPQLGALPRGLDAPQHPLWLHEPLHRHLLLLPDDVHRLHPSHFGKGVPDLELATLAVHPHLQLYRLELLPPPVLPLSAGSRQLRHHASHDLLSWPPPQLI